ncbi:HAD-like protein [Hortaea werneckii]|nr:HAD-like protein [Hortaea werneckii]
MHGIKYLLFDCDNTLVLSEDLAFAGCATLANEILSSHNIPHRYTGPTLQHEFVGMGFKGQLAQLQRKFSFSLPPDQEQEYIDRELSVICANLAQECEPCDGVLPVLERIEARGSYGMAIVSSSAMPRVLAGIRKAGMERFFPEERRFSAATSLHPPSSKPDPTIYEFACERVGCQVGEAVAIEDSRSGATAATRAGIPLLGYVGPYLAEGGRAKQDQMARVLTEECGALAVMYHWDEFEEKMAEVVRAVDAAGAAAAVADTSAVDDGLLGDAEETVDAAIDGGKVLTGQRGARDSAMSATA